MRKRWAVTVVSAFVLVALAARVGWAGKRKKEEKVTIDQVPAAVKATILKEAKGAKIKEIEKETKKGKTIYEAEFVVDGKEIEIKVAADGKLLSREVEDDDDDD